MRGKKILSTCTTFNIFYTGLTIPDREYNGDYGMPQWGDYAIVKVKDGADVPDLVTAGLFNEAWAFQN